MEFLPAENLQLQHIEANIDSDNGHVRIKYFVRAKDLVEIDTASIEQMAQPLWLPLKTFIEALLGIPRQSLAFSRAKVESFLYTLQRDSDGECPGYVELTRTTFGLAVLRDKWKQTGMLELLVELSDIDDNRFDLYCVISGEFGEGSATAMDSDSASLTAVQEALDSSSLELTALLSGVLVGAEVNCVVSCPVWEEDSIPELGSAFRSRCLLV